MINHTKTESTLDFIYLQPQQSRGRIRARIVTSPNHCKRLLLALQENLKKYKERFGEVKIAALPPGEIGILH
jgi:hypothetical protein